MTAGPATGAPPPPPAPIAGARRGARFSPQALLFVATLAIASRPLKGAIIAGLFWWWGDTYQQVQFVMDEAQLNEGYPFIAGHLDGSSTGTRVAGMMVGEQIAPEGSPQEVFAPGKRLRIWHSPSAPDVGLEWTSVNDVPVATRPVLPGLGTFLGYVAATIVTLWAGLWATGWAGRRWDGRAAQIEIRGNGRNL